MRNSIEIKILPRKVFSEDLEFLKSPTRWLHAFPASTQGDSSSHISSPLSEQPIEQDELPPLPPSTCVKVEAKERRRFSVGGYETGTFSSANVTTDKTDSPRAPARISMKQLAANVGKLMSPMSQKRGRFEVRTMAEKTH
ncbi:hypothetical protein HDU81_008742, partial [Chytriomyces hyalinus]